MFTVILLGNPKLEAKQMLTAIDLVDGPTSLIIPFLHVYFAEAGKLKTFPSYVS
jgi:hypothetical protein